MQQRRLLWFFSGLQLVKSLASPPIYVILFQRILAVFQYHRTLALCPQITANRRLCEVLPANIHNPSFSSSYLPNRRVDIHKPMFTISLSRSQMYPQITASRRLCGHPPSQYSRSPFPVVRFRRAVQEALPRRGLAAPPGDAPGLPRDLPHSQRTVVASDLRRPKSGVIRRRLSSNWGRLFIWAVFVWEVAVPNWKLQKVRVRRSGGSG
jgi:hypothetical protein